MPAASSLLMSPVLTTWLRRRSSARLKAICGTANWLLASPRQEVRDEGVEPEILAADAPQAEGAVAALAGKHALDRVLHALVGLVVERELLDRGELIDR